MPTGTGVMIPLFTSSQTACLTGSLKWNGTGIGLCLVLGTAPSFRWIWAAGPDIGGNSLFFLKDILAKCCKSHSLSLGMFCSVGRKGSFLGRVGSWSLTLLCLELVSNSWWMLADGRYCIAWSAWGDVVAAGFGKSLSSITMLMLAALLKYSLWIFFAYVQGLLGCLTQDIEFHGKLALTHECKASYSSNDFPRWDGVVCRQSHIPEMLKSSAAYGSSTVGEDRHLSAAIPGDVPSLPGIWLWREWDDVCLYLHYLACVFSRVCTRRLVKGDMSDECVHGSLISLRALPNYLCHFLCPAFPW